MGMLHLKHILQLDHRRRVFLPHPVPGVDVVHGVYLGEEISRVRGVSGEGRQVRSAIEYGPAG